MNLPFKGICDKDCESKKIFENVEKYYDFFLPTMVMNCLRCIHSVEVDNFLPREEVVEKQKKSLGRKIIDKIV